MRANNKGSPRRRSRRKQLSCKKKRAFIYRANYFPDWSPRNMAQNRESFFCKQFFEATTFQLFFVLYKNLG